MKSLQRAPYARLLERPRGIPYVNVQVRYLSLLAISHVGLAADSCKLGGELGLSPTQRLRVDTARAGGGEAGGNFFFY